MSEITKDERLAALLDGRLAEPQRAELLAALADADDEDYEVLAETAAILREREARAAAVPVADAAPELSPPPLEVARGEAVPPPASEEPPPSVEVPRGEADLPPAKAQGGGTARPDEVISLEAHRARRRRALPVWLAAAAVLAAVALGIGLWSRFSARDYGDPARLAAALEAPEQGLPEGWIDSHTWSRTRGRDDGLSDEVRAARLGALQVDLELAVQARDSAATALLASRIAGLLDVSGGAVTASVYGEIGRLAGAPPEQLHDRLEQGRDGAAGLSDANLMRLGAWTEAARIAAARRDAGFFRSRETRAALDHAARRDALPASARTAAERIRSSVAAEGELDWGVLEEQSNMLLGVLGSPGGSYSLPPGQPADGPP